MKRFAPERIFGIMVGSVVVFVVGVTFISLLILTSVHHIAAQTDRLVRSSQVAAVQAAKQNLEILTKSKVVVDQVESQLHQILSTSSSNHKLICELLAAKTTSAVTMSCKVLK